MATRRDLMLRWSCSSKLLRYVEDQTFVSSGSKQSAFISRTARCKGAWPSSATVFGGLP